MLKFKLFCYDLTMAKEARTPLRRPERKSQNLDVLPGGKLNNFLNNFPDRINKFKTSKTFYLVILAVGLTLLFFFKRSWFIAAMVNGTPVTNWELQSKLNQQFKTQTLNQMINEKIIMSEAQKGNAVPTEQEINKKITDLETSVGGKETLDGLLSQQGQTRSSLKDQIKVQLAITKLYENQATVSADEVTRYIEQNKDQLRATDSAQQQKEAYDTIKNQKLSQLFSQKFQELRTKAKIQIF